MKYQLLGPVQVRMAGGGVVDIGPPRQRAVLAALLVDAGRPVLVDTIVDRVWGQAPPERARHALYVYIARLRQVLEPVPLVRRSRGYLLDVDPASVDALRFRALVEQGRDVRCIDSERVALLREALELWRDTPLSDIEGEWAAQVAEGWRRQHIDAVTAWAQAELQSGDPRPVIQKLTALLNDYPLAEPLAAELMRALHTSGQSAEALNCYTAVRHRLAEELGIEPGMQLQDLHRAILRNEAAVRRGGEASAPVIPRQLPASAHHFVGRADELKQLTELVDQKSPHGSIVILTIAGAAGIGKTALALHWAHQVAPQFPDGQLYVNLNGFDPAGSPTPPTEAIRGFLGALEISPDRIPSGLDAQAALLRSVLAGRRMLLLLDNAYDIDQVRPLLPSSPGSLVLVTSRNQLTGLAAVEGAYPFTLDLFSRDEAHDLLARHLGPQRVANDAEAVEQLIESCGRLPIALAIVAARAAAAPAFPLSAFAGQLADAQQRLDTLEVRAVFSWSYRQLGADAARLFRLFGLYPGPDISANAAASLIAVSIVDTRRALAELAHTNLFTEHAPGRYSAHDLLRAYAVELTASIDGQAERDDATRRMLAHYIHTADMASVLLGPRTRSELPPPPDGVAPETISSSEQANAWFTAEYQGLIGAVELASAAGLREYTWGLARGLQLFLLWRGHWVQLAQTQQAALAMLRDNDDPSMANSCRRYVSFAYIKLGRFEEARAELDLALAHASYKSRPDLEGRALAVLANLCESQGRFEESLHHAQRAVRIFEALGDQRGAAHALNLVGWAHALLGNYEQTLVHCERALAVHQQTGQLHLQAGTWDSLGYAHHHLGNHGKAVDCYRQAIAIFGELGDRYYEANSLAHLGDTYHAAGRLHDARAAWESALSILEQLRHPDADEMRAKLVGPQE